MILILLLFLGVIAAVGVMIVIVAVLGAVVAYIVAVFSWLTAKAIAWASWAYRTRHARHRA